MRSNKRFKTEIISDDRLFESVNPDNLQTQIEWNSWRGDISVKKEFDVIIVDGYFSKLRPTLSDQARKIHKNIRSLVDNVRMYLKSGGVIIFLNYNRKAQEKHGTDTSYSTYDWMEKLHLPILKQASEPDSIKSVTNSSTINNYMQYIDDSNLFIDIDTSSITGEVLAKKRSDDKPVSMDFSHYKDRGDYTREIPGGVLYLPRPISFAANPTEVVNAILNIGIEKSPRGYSAGQKYLNEFQMPLDAGSDPTEYIIDDQLASRCLKKYQNQEYNDAISTAGRLLEQRVREVAPEDLSEKTGRKLMTSAFNKADGPLQFAKRDDEQEGIMFLYAGAIGGIRNIAVHRPEGGEDFVHNFDKEMARSIIFYIDYLLTLLKRYEESNV
jgi:succinate dehydrogenase flavin-adding protein (antitoxin of CptAB toxin-antitoxin module)